MYFRFGCALLAVVTVSLYGSMLEKENLDLRRKLSHLEYREAVLRDEEQKERLSAQLQGTPEKLLAPLEDGLLEVLKPTKPLRAETVRPEFLR